MKKASNQLLAFMSMAPQPGLEPGTINRLYKLCACYKYKICIKWRYIRICETIELFLAQDSKPLKVNECL